MPFAGGDGSQSNPYQIETWEHLDSVRNNLSSYFILNNDLDSLTSGYTGIGNDFEPIGFISDQTFTGEFDGEFDGNNFSIKDLVISYDSVVGDVGLFASTNTGAVIKNLFVRGTMDINFSGADDSAHGGLVGFMSGGDVQNCVSDFDINTAGNSVGVLAGSVGAGTISNSCSFGSIDGADRVGGLVGEIRDTITNCYTVAVVSGNSDVGGLAGYEFGSTVTDSYYDTEATGQSSSDGGTGLTTSEMQGSEAETNMSGFDFTNTWESVVNGDSFDGETVNSDGYPILVDLDSIDQLNSQGLALRQGLFVWTGSTWKKVAGV